MATASYLLYAMAAAVRNDGCTWRRGAIALTLLVPTLVGGAYGYWLAHSSPVWTNFVRSALSIQYSRLAWLVGYGLISPIALVGVVRSIFDARTGKARWMASWVLLLFLLLFVVNVKFTKVCNGGQVPLSLMAGAGWAYLLDRMATWEPRWRRTLGHLAATIVGCILVSQNLALLTEWSRRSGPHIIEADLIQATTEIRRLSHTTLPTVLCDADTGSLLPGVAGFRVYAGHRALTVGFPDKKRQLTAAGFDSAGAAQDTPTDVARRAPLFDEILATSRADFLLLNSEAPALGLALAHRNLRVAGSFGRWRVFAVLR
jgi:hypothetical protein